MTVELDRQGLESLVYGSSLFWTEFNNPLVLKAGYFYSDQYGRTDWLSLDKLTDEELYELYLICRNSNK